MKDTKRRTTVPLKSIPQIVEWILKGATREELEFMANLAKRANFGYLNSILTKMTDSSVYAVFYESNNMTADQLMVFRAAKRGEVAGLKAFSMACQAAPEELKRRRKK